MALSFAQIQGARELADVLYPLCSLSGFVRAAQKAKVETLWPEGSKTRALPEFLRAVLEQQPGRFCDLMQEIVAEALPGYSSNPQPLPRTVMEQINAKILRAGFKIPELWDAEFLASLPGEPNGQTAPPVAPSFDFSAFKTRFLDLSQSTDSQRRGYQFEMFLNDWFAAYDLNPRRAFKIQGEQIDGSFELERHVYLVEARWRQQMVTQADLAVLDSRVSGHSSLGRGLFITAGTFSPDALGAHARLRPSACIGMDGQDIFLTLEHALPLPAVIRFKIRRLVEEGAFLTSIAQFWAEIQT